MNFKKLTAAALTAALTIISVPAGAFSAYDHSAVYADEVSYETELPDWVPTDFESALKFRNQHGATYVGSDLVCIVFRESTDNTPDGDLPRYSIVTTDGVMKEISRNTYSEKDSPYCYEVVVYSGNGETGDFEVALVDTWIKSSGLDLGYSHAVAHYTFTVEKDGFVKETDIYRWLPDCVEEYKYYLSRNGSVSADGKYIVFCLDSNAGTAYTWQERSSGYAQEITRAKLSAASDCTEETTIPLDGGTLHNIYAYEAVYDGNVRIDWDYGDLYNGGSPTKTLTADCVIMDGATTVLLSDSAKITLRDFDTDELLDIKNLTFTKELTATAPNGSTSVTMILASIYSNPGIARWISKYISEDSFGFNFDMPKGYKYATDENGKLLDGALSIKKYENGAADVVIRLKKTDKRTLPEEKSSELTDLKQGETRITVKDAGTGELISDSVLKETPLRLKPSIYYGGAYQILSYTVDSNNAVFNDKLAEYFRNADEFSFWPDGVFVEPEVTLYDNRSMEVVFSVKTSVLAQTDLYPGDIRVKLRDIDTGMLIPDEDFKNEPFTFRPLSSKTSGTPFYSLKKNPSVYDHTVLSSICRSDDFKGFWNSRGDEQPEINLYDNGAADIIFNVRISASGDVNGDGSFNIADVVVFQKWLIDPKGTQIRKSRAADFCTDNKLDSFDLCRMKKMLLKNMENAGPVYYDFEAQYIRTDGYVEDAEYPRAIFIKSRSELESYIEANKEVYDLSSKKTESSPDAVGFADAAEKYTDEWFESHKLLMVLVEDGSGSTRFKVSQVSDRSAELYRIPADIGTCDMAEWHILIELDKNANILNEDSYKAEFVRMSVS